MDLNTRIKALGACLEAVTWAETQESVEGAWESCARGDWLLWFAARVGVDHHVVRLAACRCASRALRYVPGGEYRPRLAIEAAETYSRGEIDLDQFAAARYDAEAVVWENDWVTASDGDWAAAWADAWNANWVAARVVAWPPARSAAMAAAAAVNYTDWVALSQSAWYAAWAVASSVATAAAWDAESAVQAEIIRVAIPWALVREAIDRMDAAQ